MRTMLKSKIHRARVTDVNINYESSLTVDKKLMEEADILPGEEVEILNINNGVRFTTYAIEGEKGEVCVNGPAARQAVTGDTVIIFTYCHLTEDKINHFMPKLVYVDDKNALTGTRRGIRTTTLLEAE